jgi:formamidopyrimidine-DNA glycosylase
MPELPEIETVKRTLEPLICGATIIKCQLVRPEIIAHPQAAEFCKRISGQRITASGRRGKYLLIGLHSGDTLIAHLRMTGRMLCTPPTHPFHLHTHAVFTLDNGRELRFVDTRRFGRLWLQSADEIDDFSGIHRLGIEPFDEAFGATYLKDKLSHRHITIKQGILDQTVLAGLGNIYADEVLFAAAVAPIRPTGSLTDEEWQAIAAAVCPILTSSIARNGTTFSDYLDGVGREGQNMPYLQAYKRAGESCNRCGGTMVRIKVGGRSTFYCPNCQK